MTGATDGLGAEVRVSDEWVRKYSNGAHDGVARELAKDLLEARTQLAAERTRADEAERGVANWREYSDLSVTAARTAAEAALAEAERTIAAMKENLDPCPFSRKDCRLEPEDACPVCGDLGTWDDANMDRPSRCVTRGQVHAARLTAQAGETEGGAT